VPWGLITIFLLTPVVAGAHGSHGLGDEVDVLVVGRDGDPLVPGDDLTETAGDHLTAGSETDS